MWLVQPRETLETKGIEGFTVRDMIKMRQHISAPDTGYTGSMSEWVKRVKSLSRVRLFVTPWTVALQAPLSMGFSRQEYWSGLPFPSPGDLPNPGIGPGSPTLQADALPSEPPGSIGVHKLNLGKYITQQKCWATRYKANTDYNKVCDKIEKINFNIPHQQTYQNIIALHSYISLRNSLA